MKNLIETQKQELTKEAKKLKQKEAEFWGIVKQNDCSRGQKKACLKQIEIIQDKIQYLANPKRN